MNKQTKAMDSSPPLLPQQIKDLINVLRGMYSTAPVKILLVDSAYIQGMATAKGIQIPVDTVGILTNDNQLVFNSDQALVYRPELAPFIYTPQLTLLCGPTFIHALEYGYFRLVCNLVGQIDNLTEQDVIRHALDLMQWWKVRYPEEPEKRCGIDDFQGVFMMMQHFSHQTPLTPILDKLLRISKAPKLAVILAIIFSAVLGLIFSNWVVAISACIFLAPVSYNIVARFFRIELAPENAF